MSLAEASLPTPPVAAAGSGNLFLRAVGARVGKALLAIILPVALVVGWQLSGNNGALFGGALPTPDRVWTAWVNWAFGTATFGLNPYVGTWLQNVLFSAERVAKGFLMAIAIGVPLGIAIGWSKLVASLVDPTIQWLRPVPITAWLPISIAIFGIRDFGAIFLITIGAFYPIVINTTQGARDVDKNWIRAALMMGASPLSALRRVVLPAAMPSIFTGLRIGLGIAWTAVIVAEMVAVKSGLGYVLWDAYYVGRMDIVIADMVSIGLLGYISDRLIVALEHWVLKWRRLQSFNQ
jgi:NitT/TauT family transport system permease protein